MSGNFGPTLPVKREHRTPPEEFGEHSRAQVMNDATGAFVSGSSGIKGKASDFPLGASCSSRFHFYRVAPHCCPIISPFSAGYLRVLRKSCGLCCLSPITSFPHRLCLRYNRSLVGGGVNTATRGNVSIQTLLIIPASCECEIPVAPEPASTPQISPLAAR